MDEHRYRQIGAAIRWPFFLCDIPDGLPCRLQAYHPLFHDLIAGTL
jgi:hypothetical protein